MIRFVFFLLMFFCSFVKAGEVGCISPCAIAGVRSGILYVASAASNRILIFDTHASEVIGSIEVPIFPSGMALSPDQQTLFLTCDAPESKVCVVDLRQRKITKTLVAGHTAMAPVLSPDGKTLYVCNRFNDNISVIDLAAMKEEGRIAVRREPVAADITPDGKFLLVANHLQNSRSDGVYAAAVVSVINTADGEVVKDIPMPNGSGSLKAIRVSPDGKYAVVSHVLGRFNRVASTVRRGWININVMTILDLTRMEVSNSVILDDQDRGAANPWGLAWTPDGKKVVVTHAGTHEISIVDFPMVLEQLPNLAMGTNYGTGVDGKLARAEAAEAIPFLSASHPRIQLPKNDLGPRAVAVMGHTAYVVNYFSDSLSIIDLANPQAKIESVPLGPKQEMNLVRKGEFYFYDAGMCFQGWQSCSSCHPDARVDGLNWDLLNDGVDNPKNTKSLLLAHQTSPSMWLGVRETAEMAVRAGIKYILFSNPNEEAAQAIDAYLKSLKPVPSPHLVNGKLSSAAERGQKIFALAGCVSCHTPGLFTDRHQYDVGTSGRFDKENELFDTPSLKEIWRTAPYLHDGSAATVREVVTTRNLQDKHGRTSNLTSEETDDLCAYLLSL